MRLIQSNPLVLSSLSFLLPAIYAYNNKLYVYTILLFITSIVSVIYWVNPCTSWRRRCDLIVSKCSFTIFAINGVIYIKEIGNIIIAYSILYAFIACYYYSNILYNQRNPNWYYYHMTFHILVMVEQYIVLYSINNYQNHYTIINCYKII